MLLRNALRTFTPNRSGEFRQLCTPWVKLSSATATSARDGTSHDDRRDRRTRGLARIVSVPMKHLRFFIALTILSWIAVAPAGAESRDISIQDNYFATKYLVVTAGSTITWTNEGQN